MTLSGSIQHYPVAIQYPTIMTYRDGEMIEEVSISEIPVWDYQSSLSGDC